MSCQKKSPTERWRIEGGEEVWGLDLAGVGQSLSGGVVFCPVLEV